MVVRQVLASAFLVLWAIFSGIEARGSTSSRAAAPAGGFPGFSPLPQEWSGAIGGFLDWANSALGHHLISQLDPSLSAYTRGLDMERGDGLAFAAMVRPLEAARGGAAAQEEFRSRLGSIGNLEEAQQMEIVRQLARARDDARPEAEFRLEDLRRRVEAGDVDMPELTGFMHVLKGFGIFGEKAVSEIHVVGQRVARYRLESMKAAIQEAAGSGDKAVDPEILSAFGRGEFNPLDSQLPAVRKALGGDYAAGVVERDARLRLAKAGLAEAQRDVGLEAVQAMRVPAVPAEAKEGKTLLAKAALQGDVPAMGALGRLLGALGDSAGSYRWLMRAALSGQEAVAPMAHSLMSLTAGQIERIEAGAVHLVLRWMRKAGENKARRGEMSRNAVLLELLEIGMRDADAEVGKRAAEGLLGINNIAGPGDRERVSNLALEGITRGSTFENTVKAVPALARFLGPTQADVPIRILRAAMRWPGAKAAAAGVLGESAEALGPGQAEALMAMVREAARDGDHEVRASLMRSLSGLRRALGEAHGAELLQMLRAGFDDAHSEVRLQAELAFGELAPALGPSHAAGLVALYDHVVRGRLGHRVQSTLGGLAEALAQSRPDAILKRLKAGLDLRDASKRGAASDALPKAVKALGPAYEDRIWRMATRGMRSWFASRRAAAAVGIGGLVQAFGPSRPAQVAALVKAGAADRDPAVRVRAAQAFDVLPAALGAGQAAALQDVFLAGARSGYPWVAKEVAEALRALARTLGPAGAGQLAALVATGLENGDAVVQEGTLYALPGVVEGLQGGMAREMFGALVSWAEAGSRRGVSVTRLSQALAALAPHLGPEEAVRAVRLMRENPAFARRPGLLPGLAAVLGPTQGAEVISLYRDFMTSSSAETRQAAARGFGEVALGVGPAHAEEVLALFLSGLGDSDESVRGHVAEAVGQVARALGPAHADRLIQAYQGEIGRGDATVQGALSRGLVEFARALEPSHPGAALELYRAGLSSGRELVRGNAARALAAAIGRDEPTLRAVRGETAAGPGAGETRFSPSGD